MEIKLVTYSIISFMLFALFLEGCSYPVPCNDDSPSKETPYYLDAMHKTNIPYRQDGKDTLVYISDAGDTATLYGIGAKTYFGSEWVRREPNPDCGAGDYNLLETLEYTFEGSKTKSLYSVFFKAYLWHSSTANSNLYNQLGGGGNQSNESGTFGDNRYQPDYSLSSLNNSSAYSTKVNINGIDYIGLPIAKKERFKKENTDTLLIYNKAYGILQVKLDGQLWKLHW